MKRAILKVSGGPLCIETSDAIPEPPSRGAIVKTSFCGVCHSDLMWVKNAVDEKIDPSSNFAIGLPLVFGHEVSGKVIKIGADADRGDIKVGDKVLVYPWIGCCRCDVCNSGNSHICPNKANEVGFDVSGGFGTHVSVAEIQYVIKLPDSIPEDVACMLPCSGLTTYSAVSKIKPFLVGQNGEKYLLVIGAGGLGLWCIQIARACLPSNTKIVCADISKEKLDYVLQNGADDIILCDKQLPDSSIVDDPSIKKMKEISKGGFHAVIDLVNSSVTAMRALHGIRKGGAVVMVGLFGGDIKVDVRFLARLRITLFGIKVGPKSNLSELLELVSTGKIKFPPVTPFSLDELPDALNKLDEGKIIGRGIIKY